MAFEAAPELDHLNEDDYINLGMFIGVTTSKDGKRAALAFNDPENDDPIVITMDVDTLAALYECFSEMLVKAS